MNRKVLVMGGTKFFGKKLVEKLLKNSDECTVATRGNNKCEFVGNINWRSFDRNEKNSIKKEFQDSNWDLVYDQICMNGKNADDAVSFFHKKTDRYIMTSTAAVYDFGVDLVEEDYVSIDREINLDSKLDYAASKREAEHVFFKNGVDKKVAVRFPVVLGVDDYTDRLNYYINKIRDEETIFLKDKYINLTFISSDDAAEFLFWIGNQDFSGPINACSDQSVTLVEMLSYIAGKLDKKLSVEIVDENQKASPYCFGGDYALSNAKAKSLGFQFENLFDVIDRCISR